MHNEVENEVVNKTTVKRGRDGWGGDLCRRSYDGLIVTDKLFSVLSLPPVTPSFCF